MPSEPAAGPGFLERELAGYRVQLLERLDRLAEGIERNTRILERSGSTPAGAVPAQAAPVPLDPEVLNRLLAFARYLGKTTVGLFSLQASVAAGGSTVVDVVPYAGTVTLYLEDLLVDTTLTDPGLTFEAVVDGHLITQPLPVSLTAAQMRLSLGQFYYFDQGVQVTLTNATNTDAQVTLLSNSIVIEAEFFNSFYLALVEANIKSLEGLAAGGGP